MSEDYDATDLIYFVKECGGIARLNRNGDCTHHKVQFANGQTFTVEALASRWNMEPHDVSRELEKLASGE